MMPLLMISPILMALLPGLWSFGRMKRMFWMLTAFLLLPALLMIPGSLLLGSLGLAWRCAAVRWCGLCFLAGIALLFIWAAGYLWREIPAKRWNIPLVWLCRLVVLAAVGGMCIAFTLFGSLWVLLLSDIDHTVERDGERVVVQYLWNDGCNYYDYHGPLFRGTELLEGSSN